jgi:hypothetical protein
VRPRADTKARLVAQGEAVAHGIFGAPSFVTPDGELFWGNDRLDHAIEGARARRRRPGNGARVLATRRDLWIAARRGATPRPAGFR